MAVINRFHCIRDNTVETVNNGHPKDLSKVAVIDTFRASKEPKGVAAGRVVQVTAIYRLFQWEIGGDCLQVAAMCR